MLVVKERFKLLWQGKEFSFRGHKSFLEVVTCKRSLREEQLVDVTFKTCRITGLKGADFSNNFLHLPSLSGFNAQVQICRVYISQCLVGKDQLHVGFHMERIWYRRLVINSLKGCRNKRER